MPKSKTKGNKKTVLVGGCFDILHFGHIAFLKEAKKKGDYLIIALESDQKTKRLKGPKRPFHTQKQRAEILESLSFVNKVVKLPDMKSDIDYLKLVKKIKPNIIAITENDPIKTKKESYAKEVGATLIEIKKTKSPSTTQIARVIGLE